MIKVMTLPDNFNLWHLYNHFILKGNEIIDFIDGGILDLDSNIFLSYWKDFVDQGELFYKTLKGIVNASVEQGLSWDIDFTARTIDYEFEEEAFDKVQFGLSALSLKPSYRKKVKDLVGA